LPHIVRRAPGTQKRKKKKGGCIPKKGRTDFPTETKRGKGIFFPKRGGGKKNVTTLHTRQIPSWGRNVAAMVDGKKKRKANRTGTAKKTCREREKKEVTCDGNNEVQSAQLSPERGKKREKKKGEDLPTKVGLLGENADQQGDDKESAPPRPKTREGRS